MPEAPLTDLAFNVLVALTGEELHGYGLVKRLQALDGRATLRTGTVYAALARLQGDGWVEEVAAPPDTTDGRRRYYRTTESGRVAAREEAARLSTVLTLAQRKDLLGDPGHG